MIQPNFSSENDRKCFFDLADKWHSLTDAYSVTDMKTEHPIYVQIIIVGEKYLSFILEDLRDRGGHWFAALEEITGIQPQLSAGAKPGIRSEREAWLSWGRSKGLLS